MIYFSLKYTCVFIKKTLSKYHQMCVKYLAHCLSFKRCLFQKYTFEVWGYNSMVEYITHHVIKHKAHNSGERGGVLGEDRQRQRYPEKEKELAISKIKAQSLSEIGKDIYIYIYAFYDSFL